MTNIKTFSVAVVGATGLVGRKMLEILEERKFPVSRLLPVASEKSDGTLIRFAGQKVAVKALDQNVFEGIDFALFSAGKAVSREYAPVAAKAGTIVIDNSSAWRMDPTVPLVVPEVNSHALQDHQKVIANPNCSTIQLVVVLHPLHRAFEIKRVVVSTYQSVSGSGKRAIQQLEDEIRHGKSSHPYYPHPIAFNCLPHIDVFGSDGYTFEEIKMINETRKIMELPDLPVTATTVRVPVRVGHSESVNVEFHHPFSLEKVHEILEKSPGIVVQDQFTENQYPLPLKVEGHDEVFVGRIRRDQSVSHALNLWIVSDNLRKGAATNAVQIAETLIEKNWL